MMQTHVTVASMITTLSPKIKNWILLTITASTLVLSSGCVLLVGAAAGAGTVAYTRGDLKSLESATLDKVYNASIKGLEELEFKVTLKEKDALGAKIIARGANDRKVQVNLKRKSEAATELSIRVNTFGDEAASVMIHERIVKKL